MLLRTTKDHISSKKKTKLELNTSRTIHELRILGIFWELEDANYLDFSIFILGFFLNTGT